VAVSILNFHIGLLLIYQCSDFAIPFCSQYLTAHQLTPYALVRETMRVFSYALSKRRKIATVFWQNDHNLILGPHTINLNTFRSFILFHVEQLEDFIRTDVLFGKTLHDLDITVDFTTFSDSGNMTDLQYNPLLESIQGNPDSDTVLDCMLQEGSVVKINPNANQMTWDPVASEQWLGNIHQAASRLQPLAHVTQGAPGRISEESKMQLTNTEVGRRHLIILSFLNTIGIWSNYSKTTKVSGAFKEVLRVYPYRISRLLFILIRLIRPIEVLYHIQCRPQALEIESELVVTAYKSRLWTSFGTAFTPDDMRSYLPALLMSEDEDNQTPFPFRFGVRTYREFAAAVQRRHIQIPIRYSRAVAQQDAQVGDLQAGRTTATSLQNYAVEKSVIDMEPGFIHHYIMYSRSWQRFWGWDMEGKDNTQYLV
jgi:hypothetical protein